MQTEHSILDSLYSISSLVNQTNSPQEALEIIIDEIMAVLPAASASIILINPDTGMLEIEAIRGLPEESREIQLRMGQGVTGWVALHGEPLIVEDARYETRYYQVVENIRSELAVPMTDKDTVIGVVNVDSPEICAFTEDHLKLLTLLTNEAAKVVSNLWLINQLKTKNAQLEAIVNAGQIIGSKLELGSLLNSLTLQARRLLDCKLCALYLHDGKSDRLRLHALADKGGNVTYEEELEPENSALGTALRRNKQVEVYNLRKTEEHHFVELTQNENLESMLATPLRAEGEVIGLISAYTDFPHRFNNEEKSLFTTLASLGSLAIQNVRLYYRVLQSEETLRNREKLTTLGLLSAEIAHEIRNPLTVIELLFDGLDLDYPENDLRQQDVKVIKEKLNHLEKIVSRVLSFSKTGRSLYSYWDIGTLIEDTLHLVRLKLEQSRIKVEFNKPEDPLKISGDKGQLQQALLNLVINAMQAIGNDGIITLHTFEERIEGQDRVIVDISDTGHGIPDHIHDRIFDSFLSSRHEGTGLGLSIVKRILSSHRGDIALMESSDKGTRIRIWLPKA